MGWRIGIPVAFIVAAAVLAYQIGSRLSDEAILMIAGVTCGIIASIPVSLGLLIALTRDRTAYAAEDPEDIEPEPRPAAYPIYRPTVPQAQQMQSPQIIVLAPPQQQLPPGLSPYGNYLQAPMNALPPPMQERNFKIVGEDEGE